MWNALALLNPGLLGRLLLPAVRAATDDGAGRAGRAAHESAGRSGPAAADVPDRVARGGEACVCDLNDAFDLSQPTISHT